LYLHNWFLYAHSFSTVYRRTLLRFGPPAVTVGLAGCTGDESDGTDGGGSDGTPTPTKTDTPTAQTPTDTPTGTETPGTVMVEDASLTVVDIASGQERDAADVGVENGTVVVEGTIWGTDGCKTATLDAATYDEQNDTLRITVATTDREDAGDVCSEAIVEIDYRARVTVSGDLPGTVAVVHDGRTVTTTSPE
jgi:hypothetical protein